MFPDIEGVTKPTMTPLHHEVLTTRPPRKRALLIGVTYSSLCQGLEEEKRDIYLLEGAHHDVKKLKHLLTDKFGYKREDIVVLSDFDELKPKGPPTRENILNEAKKLVADAQAGDSFVFHFSGHGSQIPNVDGTEDDGFDEIIWPCDINLKFGADEDVVENYIMDNELKAILVDPLPDGSRLTAILDFCHSGTAMDLPFESESDSSGPSSPLSPILSPLSTSSRLRSGSLSKMKYHAEVERSDDSIVQTVTRCSEDDVRGQSPTPEAQPVSRNHPIVSSWSSCLDSQIEWENKFGGSLIRALSKIFKGESTTILTNQQVLAKLTQALYEDGEKASQQTGTTLYPKPQLSSANPLRYILNQPFIL